MCSVLQNTDITITDNHISLLSSPTLPLPVFSTLPLYLSYNLVSGHVMQAGQVAPAPHTHPLTHTTGSSILTAFSTETLMALGSWCLCNRWPMLSGRLSNQASLKLIPMPSRHPRPALMALSLGVNPLWSPCSRDSDTVTCIYTSPRDSSL